MSQIGFFRSPDRGWRSMYTWVQILSAAFKIESRSGYKDRPIGRFSPSPSVVWQSVLWPGDWRILLLCIYIPAPFTESFDRLGRRMIFKVAGEGIELEPHNSSWPFSERLTPRPTLLPLWLIFSKFFSVTYFVPISWGQTASPFCEFSATTLSRHANFNPSFSGKEWVLFAMEGAETEIKLFFF